MLKLLLVLVLLSVPVYAQQQSQMSCEDTQDQLTIQYGNTLSTAARLSLEVKKLVKENKELKEKLDKLEPKKDEKSVK